MPPVVDWYVNQIAAYGLLPVLAAEAGLFLTTICGLSASIHAIRRHRIRRSLHHLEHYANHPGIRAATDHHQPARREETP